MIQGGGDSLGSVAVDVYADLGQLETDFAKARKATEAFDREINKAAGSVDKISSAIERTVNPANKSQQALDKSADAAKKLATEQKGVAAAHDTTAASLSKEAAQRARISAMVDKSIAQAEREAAVVRKNSQQSGPLFEARGTRGQMAAQNEAMRASTVRLNAALRSQASASKETVRANAEATKAVEQLRSKYAPATAALEKYDREIDKINAALKANAITTKEAANFTRAAGIEFEKAGRPLGNMAKFAELAKRNLVLLAAAIGTAVLLSLKQAIANAFEMGKSIASMSKQLGISTTEFQKWTFIAKETGVEQSELEQGFENLQRVMGRAAAGAKRETNLFKLLGVSLNDASGNAKDAAQIMPELADALLRIENANQRAAVAQLLFGEAAANIMPALAGGSARIDELRDAAERLGIVLSEDEIRNLDETNKKLEDMKTILSVRVAQFVAENSDAILEFAESMTTLAKAAIEVVNALSDFARSPFAGIAEGLVTIGGPLGTVVQLLKIAASLKRGTAGTPTTIRLDLDKVGKNAPKPGPPIDASAFLKTVPKGPRGPSADTLARRAEAARIKGLRDDKAFEDQIAGFQTSILRAAEGEASNAVQRAEISTRILDIEKERFERGLALEGPQGSKKFDAAEVALLREKFNELDAAKRREIELQKRDTILKDQLSLDTSRLQNDAEMLSVERGLAKSRAEQRDIERELLDIQHRMETAKLDELIAASGTSDTEREIAEERKKFLALLREYQEDVLDLEFRSEVDKFLDSLTMTRAELDDALDRVRADTLADRVARSAQMADDMGEAFANVGRDVLALKSPLEILRNLIGSLASTFQEEVLIQPLQDLARSAIGAPLAERVTGAPAGPEGIWIRNLGEQSLSASFKIDALGLAATRAMQGFNATLLGGIEPLGTASAASASELQNQSLATSQFGSAIAQAMAALGAGTGGGNGFLGLALGLAGAAFAPGAGPLGRLSGDVSGAIAANPGIFHDGGIVGPRGMPMRRARRSLRPGEHNITVEEGERVIDRDISRRFGSIIDGISEGRMPSMGGIGGASTIMQSRVFQGPTVNLGGVTVNGAPDKRTGRRTGKQIAAEVQRGIARSSKQGIRTND